MIGVDRVAVRFRISKNKSARNARNRTRTTPRRSDSDHAKCIMCMLVLAKFTVHTKFELSSFSRSRDMKEDPKRKIWVILDD